MKRDERIETGPLLAAQENSLLSPLLLLSSSHFIRKAETTDSTLDRRPTEPGPLPPLTQDKPLCGPTHVAFG